MIDIALKNLNLTTKVIFRDKEINLSGATNLFKSRTKYCSFFKLGKIKYHIHQ